MRHPGIVNTLMLSSPPSTFAKPSISCPGILMKEV